LWAQIGAWLPDSPADFFAELFSADTLLVLLDIALIAFLVYKVLMFIRGTRGMQLLKGFVVLVIFSALSNWLHLKTVGWLLDKMWASLFVAIPVVFQPELRRMLEQLGRGHFFRTSAQLREEELCRAVEKLVRGVENLSRSSIGALVVIERQTGLNDLVEGAVPIDGLVSEELLTSIFYPHSPLHDGAAVLRGERIVAACAVLPLSDSPHLDKDLGTRHRAAVGITESTDALAVVVSEETGAVSLAADGRLRRCLSAEELRAALLKELLKELRPEPPESAS